LKTALVALAYFALGVALYWPVWRRHPTSTTPLGGDQWLSTWALTWAYKAVTSFHNPFFTDYTNYPTGVNFFNNTNLTLIGVVGSPITWLFGPIATTNVALTAGPPLSALAEYALVRRFTSWRPAAFFGGLLYGFSPFVILHSYIHINFTFLVFPPLILLALHELVVRQQRSAVLWGIILGALLVAQALVFTEILATVTFVAGGALIATLIVGRRRIGENVKHALRGLSVAAGVAAVLLAYPAWMALRGPAHIVGIVRPDAQAYRANLLASVIPSYNQALHSHAFKAASDFAHGENGSYLGLPLIIAVIAIVVVLRRHTVVIVAASAAAVAYVLSLGGALALYQPPATRAGDAVGRVPLPEALIAHLPLMRNLIPAHFALYVPLFLGIVLGYGLDRLHGSLADSARQRIVASVVPIGIAVVVLLPMFPAKSRISVGDTGTPRLFRAQDAKSIPADSVALVYPYPSGAYPGAMVWQAMSRFRFKMPGGYALVPQPPTDQLAYSQSLGYTQQTPLAEALVAVAKGRPPAQSPALRRSLRAEISKLKVATVIAKVGATPGQSADPATTLSFFRWLLGPPTEGVGSTYVWRLGSPAAG